MKTEIPEQSKKIEPVLLQFKSEIEHLYSNKEFIQMLSDFNFIVISVLMDKKEHNEKYSTWKYDPYHYCMEIIVERFYYFLRDKHATGDLMFEGRGGKEDMRLKKSFTRIYENGTHFVSSADLQQFLTSKQLKIKPKQANVSGLQIADLLAHPVRRFIFSEYLEMKEEQRTFGDEIIKVVKNKFHSNKSGKIAGYGVKVLP